MLDDPFKYGLLVALAIALLVAAFTDLKSRRIANWLNGAIALGAPLFWWASEMALWPDIALQIAMATATFAVLSILFAIKAMGGGDVKLLTAAALWFDLSSGWKMLVAVAIVGGLVTIVMIAVRHLPWPATARTRIVSLRRDEGIPYGVAIAAGVGLSLSMMR